jgi:hypothetical protein
MEAVDWKNDPSLKGRFHPNAPDDIEVVIHDGHPGFSGKSPERAWVRVRGRRGSAWMGTLLNQPFHLKSKSEGSEVLFVAPAKGKYLVQVSEQYLREREEWRIGECSQCGMTETLSPPSEILTHTNVPADARSQVRQVTAPCPFCKGSQVLSR